MTDARIPDAVKKDEALWRRIPKTVYIKIRDAFHDPDWETDRKRSIFGRIVQVVIRMAGYPNWVQAWNAKGNRFVNMGKALVIEACDTFIGSFLMPVLRYGLSAKMAAGAALIGITIASPMAIIIAAMAVTAVICGFYNYFRNYLSNRFFIGSKEDRQKVRLVNRARALMACLSMVMTVAEGLGAIWLIDSGKLDFIIKPVKHLFHRVFPETPDMHKVVPALRHHIHRPHIPVPMQTLTPAFSGAAKRAVSVAASLPKMKISHRP